MGIQRHLRQGERRRLPDRAFSGRAQVVLGHQRNLRHFPTRPGVRHPGMMHPGLIGCLPDHKLLAEANRREAALIATNPDRVPPLAAPPNSDFALIGQMTGGAAASAAKEVWRISGWPDQGRRRQIRHHQPDLQAESDRAAFRLRLSDLRGHLCRRAHGRTVLSRRARRLSSRLPERHRIPEEVRLHGRAGIHDTRHRTGRGAD